MLPETFGIWHHRQKKWWKKATRIKSLGHLKIVWFIFFPNPQNAYRITWKLLVWKKVFHLPTWIPTLKFSKKNSIGCHSVWTVSQMCHLNGKFDKNLKTINYKSLKFSTNYYVVYSSLYLKMNCNGKNCEYFLTFFGFAARLCFLSICEWLLFVLFGMR